MNIKKSFLIGGLVATVGVSSVGLGVVSAAPEGFHPDKLISVITGKAVDEAKSESHVVSDFKAQPIEAQLAQLVREGKLTEDQKSKMVTKHAELQAQMEVERKMDLSNKTMEEMSALIQERQNALKAWVKENGIPVEYMNLILGLPLAQGSSMIEPTSGTTTINE
ncbi:MAG TPA: hypothetical protein VFT87_00255 [Candidatus Saccharimonadales bacterium]|nr:hypothetical protein [Candidatus Saccharimonadales bacterium]